MISVVVALVIAAGFFFAHGGEGFADTPESAPAEAVRYSADPSLAPTHPVTPFGILYKDAAEHGRAYTKEEIRAAFDQTGAFYSDAGQKRLSNNVNMQVDGVEYQFLFEDGLLCRVNLMQRDDMTTRRFGSIYYWGSTVFDIETFVIKEHEDQEESRRYCEENADALYERAMDCYNGRAAATEWTYIETEQIPAGQAGTPTEIRPDFDPGRTETLTPVDLDPAWEYRDPGLLMTLKVGNCPDGYPFGDHLILYKDASGVWKKLLTIKLLEEQADGESVTYLLPTGDVTLWEITALAGPIPLEADAAANAELDAAFYYGVRKS